MPPPSIGCLPTSPSSALVVRREKKKEKKVMTIKKQIRNRIIININK
jgi:hypothetical protein